MDPSTGDSSGLTTYWGPIEAAAGMSGCDLDKVQYIRRERGGYDRVTLFLLHAIE